jgi:hypothetical protein
VARGEQLFFLDEFEDQLGETLVPRELALADDVQEVLDAAEQARPVLEVDDQHGAGQHANADLAALERGLGHETAGRTSQKLAERFALRANLARKK